MKRPRFDLSKLMDMHGEGSAKVIMQRIEKVDFYFYFFSNEKTALQNLTILRNTTLFLETFFRRVSISPISSLTIALLFILATRGQ